MSSLASSTDSQSPLLGGQTVPATAGLRNENLSKREVK
jgi:hypothetical protein